MPVKRKRLLGGITLFLAFFALALFFGFFDMAISQSVVDTENAFGLAMELSGMLVAPFLAVLSGMVIFIFYLRQPGAPFRPAKMALGFLFFLCGLVYVSSIYARLHWEGRLTVSILTGIACAASVVWLIIQPTARLYEWMKIAAVTLVYLLVVLVVINLIKLFWGRVRYRELTDLNQFTSWFFPQGITGHLSFPSGHTANAATLYVITMFAPLTRRRWKKIFCYALPILWILVMAVSRVLVGAHYASDVLFGGCISILLFYLVKAFVLKRIRLYVPPGLG